MVKYLLFTFNSLVAVGIGANLLLQIQEGELWAIILACFSCLFILTALFFTCKLWYNQGSLDVLKKLRQDLKLEK